MFCLYLTLYPVWEVCILEWRRLNHVTASILDNSKWFWKWFFCPKSKRIAVFWSATTLWPDVSREKCQIFAKSSQELTVLGNFVGFIMSPCSIRNENKNDRNKCPLWAKKEATAALQSSPNGEKSCQIWSLWRRRISTSSFAWEPQVPHCVPGNPTRICRA